MATTDTAHLDADDDAETMTDHELVDALAALLSCEDDDLLEQIADGHTFADAGVLTMNAGLVLRLADGSEFQLTVVRSR